MIIIDKPAIYGVKEAIRGMRNPMNSWNKSDSKFDINRGCYYFNEGLCLTLENGCGGCAYCEVPDVDFEIGENDLDLMERLSTAGSDHSKYLRMITVYVDITAPMYWWKEFDTYKVGTVRNSCSTMHKITAKEFTIDDFSHEHLEPESIDIFNRTIEALNSWRDYYIHYDEYEKLVEKKIIWWQLIQLLPSSYNQKATIMLNYQVLKNIYHSRKNHKLGEWRIFCEWIEKLPYSELITGGNE